MQDYIDLNIAYMKSVRPGRIVPVTQQDQGPAIAVDPDKYILCSIDTTWCSANSLWSGGVLTLYDGWMYKMWPIDYIPFKRFPTTISPIAQSFFAQCRITSPAGMITSLQSITSAASGKILLALVYPIANRDIVFTGNPVQMNPYQFYWFDCNDIIGENT